MNKNKIFNVEYNKKIAEELMHHLHKLEKQVILYC